MQQQQRQRKTDAFVCTSERLRTNAERRGRVQMFVCLWAQLHTISQRPLELRSGRSCKWRSFVWHCAAVKFEKLSVCGRVRFRFARIRFEQRNSAWIETESARSAAEVSSLVVLNGLVRKGGGRGRGRGGEDCQIWRNEQRSLVRQMITQTWVWTSLIQTNQSTTLVWAPCDYIGAILHRIIIFLLHISCLEDYIVKEVV